MRALVCDIIHCLLSELEYHAMVREVSTIPCPSRWSSRNSCSLSQSGLPIVQLYSSAVEPSLESVFCEGFAEWSIRLWSTLCYYLLIAVAQIPVYRLLCSLTKPLHSSLALLDPSLSPSSLSYSLSLPSSTPQAHGTWPPESKSCTDTASSGSPA